MAYAAAMAETPIGYEPALELLPSDERLHNYCRDIRELSRHLQRTNKNRKDALCSLEVLGARLKGLARILLEAEFPATE